VVAVVIVLLKKGDGIKNSKSKGDNGLTVHVTKIDMDTVRLEWWIQKMDCCSESCPQERDGFCLFAPHHPQHTRRQQLNTGQELQGTIERVEYGCLVFQGCEAARLLRIQSVSDLYGTYIGKADSSRQAGTRGSHQGTSKNVTGKTLLTFTNAN
jgi:hypothetical protein